MNAKYATDQEIANIPPPHVGIQRGMRGWQQQWIMITLSTSLGSNLGSIVSTVFVTKFGSTAKLDTQVLDGLIV